MEDIDEIFKNAQEVRTSIGKSENRLLPIQMNALVLAYVGDTVYDLYVRTMLIGSSDATANTLHKRAIDYVCASAQAQAAQRIIDLFNEQEMSVFKRGRNSKHATVPKNADLGDYHKATGLESVFGYLYLQGEMDRLTYLLKKCVEKSEEI